MMSHSEEAIFADDLSSSSFLNDVIETSSSKIKAKSNEFLSSFDKDSSRPSSRSSEKSFVTANGELSSVDRTYVSTLKI